MKAYEFSGYLKKGKIDRVILIHGDESFLMDEVVGHLYKTLVDPATKDFNLDVFKGDDADVRTVSSVVASWPMIGQHRVVIVRHIDRMNKSNRDKMLPFIEKPPDTTYQIFTATKINKRDKFFAAAIKNGVEVDCKSLYESQIPRWIQARFTMIGKGIESVALQRLQSSVGTSLYDLANEIEKLDIYTGSRKKITLEDVEFVVGKWRVNNIYELQNKIGHRQTGEALVLMRHLLQHGEPPLKIVASLMYYFVRLLKARAVMKDNLPKNVMAGKIGVSPFFVDDTLAQARKYRDAELERNFRLLYESDLDLKTSGTVPEALMERLTYELCAKMSNN